MSLLVFLIGVSPASAKEAESTSYSTLNEVLSPQEVHALENEFSPEELEAIERSINQGLAQAESGVYDGGYVGSLGAHVPMAPNGCTMSPDRWGSVNFRPSCDAHDICYSPSSTTNRYDCDRRFLANLIVECNRAYRVNTASGIACSGVAGNYYGAVRSAGWMFYKGRGANN